MNDLKKRFPREVNGKTVNYKERFRVFLKLNYNEELFMELFYLHRKGEVGYTTTGYLEWVALQINEVDFNSLSKEKRDFITKCQLLILENYSQYAPIRYRSPDLEEIFRLTTL